MSETNSSNNIVLPVGWTPASTLINSTGDAMDNIFDVLIDWPSSMADPNNTSIIDSEAAVSYRATGFDIPEPKTKTYEVTWHGIRVKKIASGVDMDRSFKLTYRLDANYALYAKFTAWKKYSSDVNTSGVSNTNSALGKVQVIAPGAEYNSISWTTPSKEDKNLDDANLLSESLKKTTNLVWTFQDVSVTEVSTPKFKNGATGNKMEYTVNFIFGDVSYPFYDTANGVAHNHRLA